MTMDAFASGCAILGIVACGCGGNAASAPPVVARVPVVARAPVAKASARVGCSAEASLPAADPEIHAAMGPVRAELFARERETVSARWMFDADRKSKTEEERRVAIENESSELDERERCGGAPRVASTHIRAASPKDPALVFFSGDFPTDAGGVGDMSSWGLLVVRSSDEWKAIDLPLTATALVQYRNPTGRRVLSQSNVGGQCSSTLRVFMVPGPTVEMLLETEESRSDMADVCNAPPRRVDAKTKAGVLVGFDLLVSDEGKTSLEKAWRWKGEKLVVER